MSGLVSIGTSVMKELIFRQSTNNNALFNDAVTWHTIQRKFPQRFKHFTRLTRTSYLGLHIEIETAKEYTCCIDVFTTLSNIKDERFCKNTFWLLDVNHFAKSSILDI